MIRRYRTTRRSRERVSELSPLSFNETLSLDARLIYVDPSEEGPSFLGFGGALTRASQELLHEMGEGTRKEALSRGVAYLPQDTSAGKRVAELSGKE